jgi:polysaccharide export outer membrane protein
MRIIQKRTRDYSVVDCIRYFNITNRKFGAGGLLTAICCIASAHVALGQVPQPQLGPAAQQPLSTSPGLTSLRPDYVLGPNDQILIRSPQSDDINEKPFRIEPDGYLKLPIVGRVRADGLTVQGLEADLVNRLREYIREPLVSITVTQYRSEFVYIVGAFRAPGLYPLQGRRSLIEVLTAVGGLQPNASRRIKIVRRSEAGPIPLPNAVEDAEKKLSSVEISIQSLAENVNPAEDIILRPYDTISVERAERVYVSGEVGKVAAIELGERDSISIAQALTEAGGFTQFAHRDKVRILRPVLGTNRRAEFEIDLKRVFEGKDIDFPLLPNDVLYVPRSSTRSVFAPMGQTFLGSIPYIIVTGLLR